MMMLMMVLVSRVIVMGMRALMLIRMMMDTEIYVGYDTDVYVDTAVDTGDDVDDDDDDVDMGADADDDDVDDANDDDDVDGEIDSMLICIRDVGIYDNAYTDGGGHGNVDVLWILMWMSIT